ncbi:hypothetical protein Taro_014361 [Colocasia esculenta]|uniref:Uncharacterized protein n=1 Tax=Colocasia esculenta TaxID=4460 RepID=A0A843UJ69_COLES|nr:hypothetical protein [Colocasia esculenta]
MGEVREEAASPARRRRGELGRLQQERVKLERASERKSARALEIGTLISPAFSPPTLSQQAATEGSGQVEEGRPDCTPADSFEGFGKEWIRSEKSSWTTGMMSMVGVRNHSSRVVEPFLPLRKRS